MGNSCSCFHFKNSLDKELDSLEREPSWFPSPGVVEFPVSEGNGGENCCDVVKLENGELKKARVNLPHGAAANLCSLICQTYDLALLALHSKLTSFYLVKKLISIQEAILSERLLLADGVLMLQAQELALEVGQMIKLFSCRGWLARLNRPDVDDDVEFDRLVKGINLLQERCGLPISNDAEELAEIHPSSSVLIETLTKNGGLHHQIDKNEEDLQAFVEELIPGLSVESETAAQPIAEEIRIAAAAEMPASHTVIRHPDLRYIWWTYFDSEEATWEDFWKFFPDALTGLEDSSDAIGDLSVVRELLQSPGARRQFKSAVNYCRNSEHVLSIEVDTAFAPNKTIEESVAILLNPLEGSPVNLQDKTNLLRSSVLSSVHRVIQDDAGVPSEGTEIVGRVKEVGEICAAIETGQGVIMITGTSGIGKTAVATTVADELLKSGIVSKSQFINLCNIREFSDAIFRLGVCLKHPIYQSAISSESRLKNWLSRHGDLSQPTCWVLDGLDQLMFMLDTRIEFFGLLSDILNFSPKLNLILTCSELPDLSEISCIDKVIELEPLPEQDSFRLAESLLGGALSHGEAKYLVSAAEGFPLGIKIGGNGILSGGCSASHFTERLKRVREDFAAPMRSGWNRCHDIIREGIHSLPLEDKQGLILLTQCPDNFTVDHAAAVLCRSQRPTQTWSLLWRLMMRGFLRYIPSDGSYRMEESVYDLVSVCHEVKNSEGRQEGYEELSGQCSLEIDEDVRDAARAGLVIHYLRLIDRALLIFRSGFHLSTYRLLEQECDGFDKFTKYISEASVRKKLLLMGHRGKLLKLLKILNDFLVDVGKHYFNWYQVKAICDAIRHLWEEDSVDGNYDEVSYKLRLSLANALANIGERQDAKIVLNQMENYIDSLESCSDKDLKAKANLIVIRAKIQHLIGRYSEAEALFLQGLQAQQGVYGQEHFTVSRTYSMLATVQQILQKYDDAEKSYKSSLKIRMKHANKNVMEVPAVMHNWASLNHKLGKHADAETLYIKSLILREKYLGHKNVEVASTLVSLAAVKVSLQELEEARNLYSRALSMLKDIVGEDHLAVSYTSTRLGVLLESQKSYEEAVQLFADALMIDLKVYGDQHETVLKTISRIQRVAFKHAQKLTSVSQLEMWKTYIEKLLSPFHYIWPEVAAKSGQGLETVLDLFGTNHSISGTIVPGALQDHNHHTDASEAASFQGFIQVKENRQGVKSGSGLSTQSDVNNPQNNRGDSFGSEATTTTSSAGHSVPSTPHMALGPRSRSALGTFFGDPPTNGHESTSSQLGSLRKYPSYSDPQSSKQMDIEKNNSVPSTYSAVHDNAQYHTSHDPGPSNMETATSIPNRSMEDCRVPLNAYITFSLEDDLLETTALVPEQYDAIQSMIKNPLYRAEDRRNAVSPAETPEPLINTYASFEL